MEQEQQRRLLQKGLQESLVKPCEGTSNLDQMSKDWQLGFSELKLYHAKGSLCS
jgi:hypothetical protein